MNPNWVWSAPKALAFMPTIMWVRSDGGNVPNNAVPGGKDGGEKTYIGRAEHKGDLIPAKVVASHGCCYVSYAGGEHRYENYEILVFDGASVHWVASSGGSVPGRAVEGGRTSSGEKLYIGRTHHEGTVTVGKIQPSHECLYIPYGGCEHRYTGYEALALQ
ncbi:hypothetical protein V5799_009529 [Amblyomma americanum]|uniref:Farnesoic acid o-methyltransferase-like protein n=1 Tax=Amblyomma americanum TaxID=6943 RepID=A0AAQ4FAJ6_AMBAM